MNHSAHLQFKIEAKDPNTQARAGTITTARGEIPTPVFMPVGTHGALKATDPQTLIDMGGSILLSNTYHLGLSPGSKLVQKMGGLHSFMSFPKNILTDSGGFQVFSLHRKNIKEEGVTFHSPTGENFTLSPETSIKIQQELGANIIMAFDECIPYPADQAYVEKSIARTHRWLNRCIQTLNTDLPNSLFGIVQGGEYLNLRKRCVEEVCKHDLPGYAVGGVSVGEGPILMEQITAFTAPLLPDNKPKYVMGVGMPEDLVMLWKHGVDMSDCIIPTKFARSAVAFTFQGKMRITHKRYRHDKYPIDHQCGCTTCSRFSRSYLKHLFDSNEVLSAMLLTTHNLYFYLELAKRAREAILQGEYLTFEKKFLENYRSNE